MGRGKIEMKKIESTSARHVTFSKRRSGLFKKARELAILCDAEVAIIIFSSSGRMFEFSSSDNMMQTLTRFNKMCMEAKPVRAVAPKPENQKQEEANENDILKQEIGKLKSKQRKMLGEDIASMDLQELQELDKQLYEGLMSVKNRKEQILMQQRELAKMRGDNVMNENRILQTQVEEIQRCIAPINCLAPIKYVPDATWNAGPSNHQDSDTVLVLGPPSSKKEESSNKEDADADDDNHSKR